jgi:Ca2+-binding RTX toxin-like protein
VRHALLLTLFFLLVAPTTAASIGRVTESGYLENTLSTKTFEYVAAPGEANAVTISRDFSTHSWVITDPGARITAGRGCRSLWSHRIRCRWADENNWTIATRDRADRILIVNFCQVSCDFDVFGGRGNDVIRNQGTYWAGLNGGLGNDSIFGGLGPDLINGGAGRDQLFGGLGYDSVQGGPGNDVLTGGKGQDGLSGNDGDDRFEARDGLRDAVRGGPGTDSAAVDDGIDSVQGVEIRTATRNLNGL